MAKASATHICLHPGTHRESKQWSQHSYRRQTTEKALKLGDSHPEELGTVEAAGEDTVLLSPLEHVSSYTHMGIYHTHTHTHTRALCAQSYKWTISYRAIVLLILHVVRK